MKTLRFRSSRTLLPVLASFLLFLVGTTPTHAQCRPSGRSCGVSTATNDLLCCPGTICGPWGNVCQPGCRIGGVAYRAGTVNPANACQVCRPGTSTKTWSSVQNGTACSDGNACTQSDTCQSGTCAGSSPVVCVASDLCHGVGTCNTVTGVCSSPAKPDGTPCTDGNACTLIDTCHAGACAGSNPVVCVASDPCHDVGICNTVTGACSDPAKPNGASCDDLNACTQTDRCQAGACAGSNPVVCVALDPCHDAGICNTVTAACSNPAKPNGTPCNDGDACTPTDTCQGAVCTGSAPVSCTPVVNGAAVELRVFDDCPISTLTPANNYPGSIQITDVMNPVCVGFANLHTFSFSADGGATPAIFNNSAAFQFGADVTIDGPGEGEAGLRISPWWSPFADGRFMLDATTGEIACFGGRLPFYSFTVNHAITYVKGTTVRLEVAYLPNGLSAADPATIQYRLIRNGTTYESPVLLFDQGNAAEDPPHGLWGILQDARAGGYFLVRANTGASLSATFTSISFSSLGCPCQ